MSDHEIPLRFIIEHPPAAVHWALQIGKDALQPANLYTTSLIVFDISVRAVNNKKGELDFRGPAVQGPSGVRFVYLNSGTLAGDARSVFTRRAKVSLMTITRSQVEQLVESKSNVLEVRINGTGKDGTPACATVPLLGTGWRIVPKNM
ncbi:MAG: DUF5990 family protein [Gemmatimonadaceae bacterium]